MIVQTVHKPRPVPDAPVHLIGSVRPGKPLTSILEEQVRAKLRAAGRSFCGGATNDMTAATSL